MTDRLGVVEQLARTNEWAFEREADGIALSIEGRAAAYHLSFQWMGEIDLLHLACGFELKVQSQHMGEVRLLVLAINEGLRSGHFDFWEKDGEVIFRHALFLPNDLEATPDQCQWMMSTALEACEHFYPAFHYILWGGKSAKEALDLVNFETVGEA